MWNEEGRSLMDFSLDLLSGMEVHLVPFCAVHMKHDGKIPSKPFFAHTMMLMCKKISHRNVG